MVSPKRLRLTLAVRIVALAVLVSATWSSPAAQGAEAAGRGATPWIGLLLEDGTLGGARVRSVVDGSPGQKSGIASGDEVVSLDDHPIDSPRALIGEVRRAGIGHLAKVRLVDSKGHTRTVSLKLEPRPDMAELERTQLLGKPAPDFAPAIQSGEKLGKLSSLRGQVVLIDFFATWCGPCVAAMPHLEGLHQRLRGRGLKVLGVSTEPAATVARAAERFHLTYPIAADESEAVSASYHVFALPTAVIVDKKGVVREVSIADVEAVDAAVAAALGAP